MDKKDLFERTRAYWPEEIDLRLMVAKGKRVRGMQVLNELYVSIENSIDEQNHWHLLSTWAFHQSLWSLSKRRLSVGREKVRPSDVSFEEFDQKIRDNLADDSWTEERRAYLESDRT